MSETNPQAGTTTEDAAAPEVAEGEEDAEEEEEEDLEKLQKEIERMEAEAARITKEADEIDKKGSTTTATGGDSAGKKEAGSSDGHSIYVGQVDYSTTPEELLAHFEACGTVERVTIVCDKYTGSPKGFAYLEFQTEASVANAIKLDGSEFKGRNLKVTPKRVNVAGYSYQQGGYEHGGGRGGRGGGGYRGGRGGRGGGRGRGRGRGYRGGYGGRGRGRGGYHPYY